MSKKRKKNRNLTDGDIVYRLSAEENTLSQMPKFNGFAGGYGAHGPRKYDRNREKRAWRDELDG